MAAPFLIRRPPEAVDPLFEHDLALELHMTVAELRHGRGAPTPLAELVRDWPLYFEAKRRLAEREEQRQANQPTPVMGLGG